MIFEQCLVGIYSIPTVYSNICPEHILLLTSPPKRTVGLLHSRIKYSSRLCSFLSIRLLFLSCVQITFHPSTLFSNTLTLWLPLRATEWWCNYITQCNYFCDATDTVESEVIKFNISISVSIKLWQMILQSISQDNWDQSISLLGHTSTLFYLYVLPHWIFTDHHI
jgi:REP element-mobilizing transposase RayT